MNTRGLFSSQIPPKPRKPIQALDGISLIPFYLGISAPLPLKLPQVQTTTGSVFFPHLSLMRTHRRVGALCGIQSVKSLAARFSKVSTTGSQKVLQSPSLSKIIKVIGATSTQHTKPREFQQGATSAATSLSGFWKSTYSHGCLTLCLIYC